MFIKNESKKMKESKAEKNKKNDKKLIQKSEKSILKIKTPVMCLEFREPNLKDFQTVEKEGHQ